MPSSLERWLTTWFEVVSDYCKRERLELIEHAPSPQVLERYKIECKILLRSALWLESMIKDPDYPARRFAREIQGSLLKLESSWKSLNNPMTDAEADELLRKHFPDDPLSQKLCSDEK